MKDNFEDIKPKSFDLEPLPERKLKMNFILNWKTSLVGLLVLIVKFLESQHIIGIGLGDFIIQTLTGLGLLVAGDQAAQKKILNK